MLMSSGKKSLLYICRGNIWKERLDRLLTIRMVLPSTELTADPTMNPWSETAYSLRL